MLDSVVAGFERQHNLSSDDEGTVFDLQVSWDCSFYCERDSKSTKSPDDILFFTTATSAQEIDTSTQGSEEVRRSSSD